MKLDIFTVTNPSDNCEGCDMGGLLNILNLDRLSQLKCFYKERIL